VRDAVTHSLDLHRVLTVAGSSAPGAPWAPPRDDALTWFKPGGSLPSAPTPLEFTFAVEAFAFGVSRALESLYFPLYEVRARLLDGELYLASVPSAMAERDLPAQLSRMRDSALRFTRSVRGSWERLIKREVAEYNDRLAQFAPADAGDREVAAAILPLRRTRANQWFAATRAVFAPTVMLQAGLGPGDAGEARAVCIEARALIHDRGTPLVRAALERVGARLARAGCIDRPEDVDLLEYPEVMSALETGADARPIVNQRKAAASHAGAPGPDDLGPDLPPDAPRMYLLRDVLALAL